MPDEEEKICRQVTPEEMAAAQRLEDPPEEFADDEPPEAPRPAPLGREAILGSTDLPVEEIDVPEWGGSVLVRTLPSIERDVWEATLIRGKGAGTRVRLDNIRASLCVRVIVDEEGSRLFKDNEAKILGRKSAKAMDRIYSVASRLNGVSEDDIEELAGNSDSDQSTSSE